MVVSLRWERLDLETCLQFLSHRHGQRSHSQRLTLRLRLTQSVVLICCCVSVCLTFGVLGKNLRWRHTEMFFSYFLRKIGFDISYILSPLEIIVCMKVKANFIGEKKQSPICRLLILPKEWYRLKDSILFFKSDSCLVIHLHYGNLIRQNMDYVHVYCCPLKWSIAFLCVSFLDEKQCQTFKSSGHQPIPFFVSWSFNDVASIRPWWSMQVPPSDRCKSDVKQTLTPVLKVKKNCLWKQRTQKIMKIGDCLIESLHM